MAVVALKPRRGYSFTDHAVSNPAAPPPGDRLDSEVDRIDRTLAEILDFLGTLSPPPAPSAPALYTAPVGVLGPSADIHAIPGADPNALAMDWAEVSAEWAEHMPDTIPPNILAVMGVTGDHWSARWWAHRALEIVTAAAGAAVAGIGPDPPANPDVGALWWCTTDGQLYVFYDDLSSRQWVAASNQPAMSAQAAPLAAAIFAPSSGAVISLVGVNPVYINNAALLAALTIRMPAGPPLGTTLEIGFRMPVTALTVQTSTAAVIPGSPTSAYGPGAAIQMKYETPGWIYWK